RRRKNAHVRAMPRAAPSPPRVPRSRRRAGVAPAGVAPAGVCRLSGQTPASALGLVQEGAAVGAHRGARIPGARRREGGGKEGRKARQSGTDAEAWGPPPVAPARGTPAHAPSARPSSRGPRRARAREGRPPVAGLGLPPRPAGRILGGSQAGPASTFACRARTLRHDN
ncbi:unnamed protein product, partial [Prorocentrum cordatum]